MRRRCMLWGLGMVLVACGLPARAQTEGLIRFLTWTSLHSYLELGYDLEMQERSSPGDGRVFGQDEGTFTIGINADLKGSFLNPAWLPFTFGGTFRRRATDVDTVSGRFEGSREDDASEYRMRLGILPGHLWSGEVNAGQFVQDIDSTFVPRRTLLRRNARFSLFRRSRIWPLRFEIGRHSADGLEGDPRDETRERFLAHLDHLGEHSTTRTDAEVLDYLEDSSGQDYRLVRFSADHNWRPGGPRNLVLNSTFYGFDRSGTSEFRNFQAGQNVDWRPRENLLLSGSVQYQDQEDRLGTLSTTRILSDFEHTLWGSLVTRLAAQFQKVELPREGTENIEELGLRFDYTRHLRPGILTLHLGGRQRDDDNDLPAGRAIVSEERVYEPGIPIILGIPGVILTSIEITDATGQPFVEGFDFELLAVGDLIEIRVLRSGSISSGETLRISFAVESSRHLELRTRTSHYGGGWRSGWGWLFRVNYGSQSQDVLAGSADGRIDQTADEEYVIGIDRPRWHLNGTYHDRESEILPYVLRRFGGSWKLPLGRRLDLTLRGRVQRMSFPMRHEETRLKLAGADLRYRIGRLRIDGTLERWNEDILGREGRHLQGHLNSRWRHRSIEILGRWRHRIQRVEQAGSDDRDELRVVVRRYFR